MEDKIKTINLKVELLSQEAFKPYGEIIGPKSLEPDISQEDLALWKNVAAVDKCEAPAQFCWLWLKKPREFVCESLERHVSCSEGIFPMYGQTVEIFALPSNPGSKNAGVNINSFKAFFLDNRCAVKLKKGVWHWVPWPLTGEAGIAVLMGADTIENDFETIDLKKELGISIRFIL